MSARIEGLREDERQKILNELADIIETPGNVYEHIWKPGDIIVRDHLSSVHARTDWPDDQKRTLRGVTIKGHALS